MTKIEFFMDGTWFGHNREVISKKLGRDVVIDYGEMVKLLLAAAIKEFGVTEYETAPTRYFSSYPENYDKKDESMVKKQFAFYETLKKVYGFNLELFSLDFHGHRVLKSEWGDFKPAEKCVDSALAVAIAEGAALHRYDICIVVAGDRDFMPALLTAKKYGKKVLLASITGHCARQYCEGEGLSAGIIWLDRYAESLEAKRTLICTAAYHPVAVPLAFAMPRKHTAHEACFCPSCAAIAAKLQRAMEESDLRSLAPGYMAGMVTEVVKARGYGFITTADHKRFFFHVSDLAGIAWGSVKCGLGVLFQVAANPSAVGAGKSIRIRPYPGWCPQPV